MFYLFGNWKSYKNLKEMRAWYHSFRDGLSPTTVSALEKEHLQIVVFPPFPLLYPLHTLFLETKGLLVGAQDISSLGEGKETGLVNGSSLKGIASYVIVGHLEERRRGDTKEIVSQKYAQSLEHSITPVLCIDSQDELIANAPFVAYEPGNAIGTGNNASVDEIASHGAGLNRVTQKYLYGGSVTAQNCTQYLKDGLVDGFLIGTVSLTAPEFSDIANICAEYVAH